MHIRQQTTIINGFQANDDTPIRATYAEALRDFFNRPMCLEGPSEPSGPPVLFGVPQ